ncbi:MAG: M16 family metallopeptidase [Bacteriovoracia bacterium]
MKRFAALFLALLAISPLAWAKTEKVRSTKLPNGLQVQEYRMENGMQVLLVQDHSAPVFTYQVWFKVGSATEKMDPKLQKTGLAHLFEHMMFRGTPTVPDGMFTKKMSAAGEVGLNASTWLDRTNYFESLPKEQLELAFQLESDRMANLAIDDKLFKTELGAVFGERKMRADKPSSIANDALWELSYDKHPYKWTTMGTAAELNSFTVDEANYFYRTYYAPNNATLILIGDFETAKALRLAEKYYGKFKAQEIPRREPPVEPAQTEARKKEVTHPLATSDLLMIGYHIPDCRHSDMPALQVLGAVLSTGNGSIMEQELVQEGIASSVGAGAYNLRYPGMFQFSINMVQGKSADKAVKILKDALARIAKGELSAAELERGRNQYLLSAYSDLGGQSSIGQYLGEALVSSDNYLNEFEILQATKKVTIADLQRVVKTYFKDENSNFIHLKPGADKGDAQ